MGLLGGAQQGLEVHNMVYNPGTFTWEAMKQPVISTDTLNVTGSFSTPNYAKATYEDGDIMYLCYAAMGASLSDAAWQIQKVDFGTTPSQTKWCDGNANFDNTATDLATVKGHTYS